MNVFHDHEIAAYVLGDAPADLRARLETAIAAEEEVAAEVAILTALAGGGLHEVKPDATPLLHPGRRRSRSLTGRAALAVSILLLLAGIAWGGYELLRTPPLMEDNFSTRTVSRAKWDIQLGRKGVSAQDGYLRLLNRGSVVTLKEFDEPIEITLDWRWIDLGQWPLYSDHFTVALRTHGEHQKFHPFEIGDSLLIEFNAIEGNVRVMRGGILGNPTLGRSPLDSVPMPSGEWHHIRIIDDGTAVSVYLEGPVIDPRYKKEPLLTVLIPEGLTGKRVAFYNREYLAGTNHESHVDNVKIWAVK